MAGLTVFSSTSALVFVTQGPAFSSPYRLTAKFSASPSLTIISPRVMSSRQATNWKRTLWFVSCASAAGSRRTVSSFGTSHAST